MGFFYTRGHEGLVNYNKLDNIFMELFFFFYYHKNGHEIFCFKLNIAIATPLLK